MKYIPPRVTKYPGSFRNWDYFSNKGKRKSSVMMENHKSTRRMWTGWVDGSTKTLLSKPPLLLILNQTLTIFVSDHKRVLFYQWLVYKAWNVMFSEYFYWICCSGCLFKERVLYCYFAHLLMLSVPETELNKWYPQWLSAITESISLPVCMLDNAMDMRMYAVSSNVFFIYSSHS